jgi:hypothetical protein
MATGESAALKAEHIELMAHAPPDKIEKIKRVRAATKVSLKRAKNMVERGQVVFLRHPLSDHQFSSAIIALKQPPPPPKPPGFFEPVCYSLGKILS